MQVYEKKTEELKQFIEGNIAPLINSDYVWWDLPYHNNIGDILIWRGESEFLQRIPHKCLNQSSIHTYPENMKLKKSTVILLHGGGNFGDIWRHHAEFRLRIIRNYPENRIIVFPQTVFYSDASLMKQDAEAFSLHKNLTLCARDEVSFELLKSNFRNNIILVPDMAFCINSKGLQGENQQMGSQTLFLVRKDKEVDNAGLDNIRGIENADIKDWPTMEKPPLRSYILKIFIRTVLFMKRSGFPRIVVKFMSNLTDNYARNQFMPSLVKRGAAFLLNYRVIITTRLHAGILAILMNKECTLVDNNYGKLSSFYNTWLKELTVITMKGSKRS